MQQNWALICGAIRSIPEFEITINAVLALRRQGLVAGIVVATWNDDQGATPELKQRLLARGITMVEVPSLQDGGNGQTFRQHRLFAAGLAVCPDGSAVLKLRSDKAAHRLQYYVERLKVGPAPQPTPAAGNAPFQIFRAKVAVQSVSVTMPFNFSDLVFYGLKEDLACLANMDLYYEWACFPGSINAEIRWFSQPFIRRLNIFRQYLENYNCRAVSGFVADRAAEGALHRISPAIMDVLAANLLVIHHNFDISSPDHRPQELSLLGLLGVGQHPVGKLVPMTLTKHVACFSNSAVAQFISGDFKDDAEGTGSSLKAALARMAAPGYVQRIIPATELTADHSAYFKDQPIGNDPGAIMRVATEGTLPDQTPDDSFLDVSFFDIFADVADEEKEIITRLLTENAGSKELSVLYFEIAERYRTGDFGRADNSMARLWLRLAAEGRYRPAEKAWAEVLESIGNLEEAAQWYRKAAVREDPEAQRALANILQHNTLETVKDDWQDWMARAERHSGAR
ncbi:MAG: sel1 repeat family protein [Alphaproteobacteria bacterium]|nr:MAG: sel1 repeat family protein [Alphaproteobacteria bacterium]